MSSHKYHSDEKKNHHANHTISNDLSQVYDFDLAKMIALQDASRMTKTPGNVLFDDHMHLTWSQIKKSVANTNKNFSNRD